MFSVEQVKVTPNAETKLVLIKNLSHTTTHIRTLRAYYTIKLKYNSKYL